MFCYLASQNNPNRQQHPIAQWTPVWQETPSNNPFKQACFGITTPKSRTTCGCQQEATRISSSAVQQKGHKGPSPITAWWARWCFQHTYSHMGTRKHHTTRTWSIVRSETKWKRILREHIKPRHYTQVDHHEPIPTPLSIPQQPSNKPTATPAPMPLDVTTPPATEHTTAPQPQTQTGTALPLTTRSGRVVKKPARFTN